MQNRRYVQLEFGPPVSRFFSLVVVNICRIKRIEQCYCCLLSLMRCSEALSVLYFGVILLIRTNYVEFYWSHFCLFALWVFRRSSLSIKKIESFVFPPPNRYVYSVRRMHCVARPSHFYLTRYLHILWLLSFWQIASLWRWDGQWVTIIIMSEFLFDFMKSSSLKWIPFNFTEPFLWQSTSWSSSSKSPQEGFFYRLSRIWAIHGIGWTFAFWLMRKYCAPFAQLHLQNAFNFSIRKGPSNDQFLFSPTLSELRVLKIASYAFDLRKTINLILESVVKLRDLLVFFVYVIFVFAVLGLQTYMGVLTQKCVKTPPISLGDWTDRIWDEFIRKEGRR